MRATVIVQLLAALLVSGALATTAFVAPARGRPLPASVDLPTFKNFDGSGTRTAIGEERELSDKLVEGLTQASNSLFARTPGWGCLSAEKLRDKWIVEVHVTVWAPNPATNDGVWSVALSVEVKTKTVGAEVWGDRIRRQVPRGASVVITATDQLREVITELGGKIKPCEAKAKVRGRGAFTLPRVGTVRYAWQGEGPLRLGPDGAFESAAPVKVQVSTQVSGCTGDATIESRLELEGSHEDDGKLVFTKMWSPEVRIPITVRCSFGAVQGQMPWGGDWTSGHDDVAMPLEDGAHVRLRPLAPLDGDGIFELEYGRRATPVSAVPRH